MFTRLDWFTREMMKRNVTQVWSIIKASLSLSSIVVFLSIYERKPSSNDALESIRPFKKMPLFKRKMSIVFLRYEYILFIDGLRINLLYIE